MKHDFSLNPTSRGGRPRRPIEVAMTPMIDVIFLLLIFFLATSSFQMVEQLLPSGVADNTERAGNAPQAPVEPTDDALEQVIVKLRSEAEGVVAELNGEMLDNQAALSARLQLISSVKLDVPVVIDPAEDVTATHVIAAYDAARSAGLSRVYLATRQPQP